MRLSDQWLSRSHAAMITLVMMILLVIVSACTAVAPAAPSAPAATEAATDAAQSEEADATASEDSDTEDSESAESGTYLFVDDLGREVEIPVNPQRIVALHDFQNAVPLVSIGAPVVGIPYRGEDFNDVLKTFDLTGVESTGGIWEQSIEKIAALQPDLIIGNAFSGAPNPANLDEAGIDRVAPTIWISTAGEIPDVMQKYGEITGLSDVVDAQRVEYEAALAKLISAVGDPSDFSYTSFGFYAPESNFYVESEDFPSPIIDVAQALGMRPIPLVVKSLAEGEIRPAISAELLDELNADLIFFGTDESEFSSLATWGVLPAVQAGQAYAIPDDLGAPTYTDLMKALAFLEPILLEADPNIVDESTWE